MKARLVAIVALAMTFAADASAQSTTKKSSPVSPSSRPTHLRSFFGFERAARLIRSGDPAERIRGLTRATEIGTPEAIGLVVDALERGPTLKSDPSALLASARGLARFADQERARVGLLAIVGAGNPGLAGRLPAAAQSGDALETGDTLARAELARHVAAIALARSGGDRALEALYGVARGTGSGQHAAIAALMLYPPRDPGFFGGAGASLPAPVVRMLGQLGDLRALDVLHAAARSSDVNVRSAALIALAELGDERAGPLARAAIAESDIRLRAASGEAFVLLAAPERFKATAAIVSDEATTAIGLRLAERVFSPEITSLVGEHALSNRDRELRRAAIRALGRSPEPNAAQTLVSPQLLDDAELGYHALEALARSPAPNVRTLITKLLSTRRSSLVARAYIVRALVRDERDRDSEKLVFQLQSSRASSERALGVFARVALGDADARAFIDDGDPAVRRAAAMASMARPSSRRLERALLERLLKEEEPSTRNVLAIGLVGGDPDGLVKTSTLMALAESGGGDAPLATLALVRRADETMSRKLAELLGSRDSVLRAHAARGLADAKLDDATGRLARAYANETDVDVRRAVVAALAARTKDSGAPARTETLRIASELDPDGPVRQTARRALGGVTIPMTFAAGREVAWLRIHLEDGRAPGTVYAGTLVRSDGLAVPIAFDEEGYALVPGLPPGEARLVLAPKLPTYKESKAP